MKHLDMYYRCLINDTTSNEELIELLKKQSLTVLSYKEDMLTSIMLHLPFKTFRSSHCEPLQVLNSKEEIRHLTRSWTDER